MTMYSSEFTRPGRTFRPNVDISENEEALWLWADLPGVDEKDVEIRLEDKVLSITAQVSTEDDEALTPRYTEYKADCFAQRFTVSSEIDVDRIRARMVNGVLELELPKAAHARPRRIEVKGADA
jgi:HSP20 family molecular chaperone IbpA